MGLRKLPSAAIRALKAACGSAMVRDALTTSIWNFLGKAVGLLIPIAIAALYGMTAGTDAFFFAYGVITFLCAVVGPIGRSTVVPFIAELRADESGRPELFIARSFLALTAVVALATSALLLLLWPLLPVITDFPADIRRLALLLLVETSPLVLLLGWTAVLEGALNAHKRFALPAVSPAFRAVVALAIIFGLRGRLGLHAVPLGYVAGEAVRVVVLAGSMGRLTPLRFRAADFAPALGPRVRAFLGVALYQNVALIANGLRPVVDRTMASWLRTGSVSVLYYADRLYMIPASLVFTGVMTVVLSHWSADRYEQGPEQLRANLDAALRVGSVLCLGATAVLILLSGPVARLLLAHGEFPEHMLPQVVSTWRMYLLGLAPQVLGMLYAQAFLTLKDTRTLLASAVTVNLLNVAFNYALMWKLLAPGIALSTTLTMIAAVLFLRWGLARRLRQT